MSSGIIEQMKKKGMNFTATSLSFWSSDFGPYNVFVEDSNYFNSLDSPGQWWEIDFKVLVMIGSYKIRAGEKVGWPNAIYNWVVSVSEDRVKWKTARTHTKTDVRGITQLFSLDFIATCRYLRILSTGQSASPNNFLVFSFIEFYGQILNGNNKKNSNFHCIANLDFFKTLFTLLVFDKF